MLVGGILWEVGLDELEGGGQEPERRKATSESVVLEDAGTPSGVNKPVLTLNAHHIPLVIIDGSMPQGETLTSSCLRKVIRVSGGGKKKK